MRSRSYTSPNGQRIVIDCAGCGTTSEFETALGSDADAPVVRNGYFNRSCPHCGTELGVNLSRRAV